MESLSFHEARYILARNVGGLSALALNIADLRISDDNDIKVTCEILNLYAPVRDRTEVVDANRTCIPLEGSAKPYLPSRPVGVVVCARNHAELNCPTEVGECVLLGNTNRFSNRQRRTDIGRVSDERHRASKGV